MSRLYEGYREVSSLLVQYSIRDQAIIALVSTIAANYAMRIRIEHALGDPVLFIEFRGRSRRVGDITQVLSMTTRGLIGIFESAREEWRDEIEE